MKAKLRNTGTHAQPIRPNYSVSELTWESGAHFKIVPRENPERHVELIATSEDGEEVSLYLDDGAMRIIGTELARCLSWVNAK